MEERAKAGRFEWYGESKRLRTDPGDFVSERRGILYGPKVSVHTIEPLPTMEMFDDLKKDPAPSVHSVVVNWSWRKWVPELKGMLCRHGYGHVDTTDWVHGEDQIICGMKVPAELTDWLLDAIAV